MGLTLHYRGRLRRPADIQPIIEELTEICTTNGWQHFFLDFMFDKRPKDGDEPFYGITFQPHPMSESVWMIFNGQGWLSHPFAHRLESDPNPLPWSQTKTQHADAETHIALCRLFQYLEKQWFAEWEVKDESEYWESGDEAALRSWFETPDEVLDALEKELKELFVLERTPSTKERIDLVMQRWRERVKQLPH